MAKTARTTTARPDDRAALERQIESLQRENTELRAKLAKGVVDESWFTPGVLSLLALGLFFALWTRYVPSGRPRGAPAAEASAAVAPSR